MSIQQKKKVCKGCGELEYLWSKGMCKKCAYKDKESSIKSYKPPTSTYKGVSMPNHTAEYLDFFGYSPREFIPSELSGLEATDINHIVPRGMGGSKTKDDPVNLMALTRPEHLVFENYPEYKEFYTKVHLSFIATRKPYYKLFPNDETLKEVMLLVNSINN
jgi:ribosomal protein L37E